MLNIVLEVLMGTERQESEMICRKFWGEKIKLPILLMV